MDTGPQLTRRHRPNWHLAHGRVALSGPVVLFDLDGVLADAGHRQHFLHLAEPNWEGFYGGVGADAPLQDGLALLDAIRPDLPVVILTARIDDIAQTTIEWLRQHGVRWDMLVCRPPADSDESTMAVDYKRVEVRALLKAGITPVLAIDDNRKIVAMYEEFGIISAYIPSGYYDNSARYDGGV